MTDLPDLSTLFKPHGHDGPCGVPPGAPAATRPLVVFTDLSICDGPGQHDVQLWTDGLSAYAHEVGGSYSSDLITRDTTQVEVGCPHRDVFTEDRCPGHARFDLADEAWTTDDHAISMLVNNGSAVER